MVKFFERKKLTRKIRHIDQQLVSQNEDLAKELLNSLHDERKQLEQDLTV